MLVLILILLLVWLALAVLFFVGTLWFQGLIYSEPTEKLQWRAPAAAAALTVFFALWCIMDYASPGRYPGPLDFTTTDVTEFKKLEVIRGKPVPAAGNPDKADYKFDDNWVIKGWKKVPYVEYTTDPQTGKTSFVETKGGIPQRDAPWTIQDPRGAMAVVLLVPENGQEVAFNLDIEKNPKTGEAIPRQPVRYLEVGGRGRVMEVETLGRLFSFRWGQLIVNLLLNLFHLAVWFLALWLLLRFQWPHALGLAFLFWVVFGFAILPMLLTRAEEAGKARAGASARAFPPIQRFAEPAEVSGDSGRLRETLDRVIKEPT